MSPTLVDASFVALWRGATRPVEKDGIEHLALTLPAACSDAGIECAVPGLATDAYGVELLREAQRNARWVEAIDRTAFLEIAESKPQPAQVLVVPSDERARPSDAALATAKAAGWCVETRYLAPAGVRPESLASALPARTPGQRVRIVDAGGYLSAAHIDALGQLERQPDLTLELADPRGHAGYLAHHAYTHTEVAVRTTLLGRAHAGGPATELLLAPPATDALRPVAEALALVEERPIPPEHPLWGARRADTSDLAGLLSEHLSAWGFELTQDETARVLTALRQRMRPGDRLDGPLLYATVAAHADLLTRLGHQPPTGG